MTYTFLYKFTLVKYLLILLLPCLAISATAQQKIKFKNLSIDNGLSQNMVNAIFQDSRGFMWFGTKDGLNRYDGYTFKIYKYNPYDSDALSDNHITCIYEDDKKNLWIGTKFGGLNIYDESKDGFVKVNNQLLNRDILLINSITGNSRDGIWVSSQDGQVSKFTVEKDKNEENLKISVKTVLGKRQLFNRIPENIVLDKNRNLWITTGQGLLQYDIIGKKTIKSASIPVFNSAWLEKPLQRQKKEPSPFLIPLRDVIIDQKDHIWLVGESGAFEYNPDKNNFQYYPWEGGATTVAPVKNRKGEIEIWFGSFHQGLKILNTNTKNLREIGTTVLSDQKLWDGVLTKIYSGSDGTVWMGTSGRGILYASPSYSLFENNILPFAEKWKIPSTSIYSIYYSGKENGDQLFFSSLQALMHNSSDNNSMLMDTSFYAKALDQDSKGNMWMGSTTGLLKYNPSSGKKIIFDNNDKIISGLHVDKFDNIWYVTPAALKHYDVGKRKVTVYSFYLPLNESKNQYTEFLYSCIQADVDGNLWVGTVNGLYLFDPKKKKFIKHFKNEPTQQQSISSNEIKSILPDPIDPLHILWIGTPVGLNKLDKVSGTFTHYDTKDGLPNNMIYGILSDNLGNLWLSTNQGLSVYNIKRRSFINFNVNNGLQSNEFNTGAYFKSRDGEIFFGGINGFNRFFPEQINIPQFRVPTVISDVTFLGLDKKNKLYFSQDHPNFLAHNQNNISILLSSLDYASPEKNRYAYRIFNQDTTWLPIGTNRNITLTNLNSGRYVLQAKGTDSFGRWNDEITEIVFIISPPWWNSLGAYMVYLFLLAIGLYYLWQWYLARLTEKHKLENERKEVAAIVELEKAKSRFLANITHEFRTPLTLINGQIERLIEENNDQVVKQQYLAMERNSHQLLQLINQLMELSKMENSEYQLLFKKGFILTDIETTFFSFLSFTAKKNIQLTLTVPDESRQWLTTHEVIYSADALKTILNNLLSNACKFVSNGGNIVISVAYQQDEKKIHVAVTDSGPGIKEEDIPKIFDRFFQSDSTTRRSYEGSGIGLSLVKELAILHGGSVSVESKSQIGSIFRVVLVEGTLPLNETKNLVSSPTISIGQGTFNSQIETDSDTLPEEELPWVLIIEDHDELRNFMRTSLSVDYQLAEATNGNEGLEVALRIIPDLIISDVMMPALDGFQLCKLLKDTEATSHIPIILLTAKASQEDKLKGLQTGADDYLTKPFSTKEIKLRVHNMIHNRKVILRKTNSEYSVISDTEELKLLPQEKAFIEKVSIIIEENLSNPQFSVEVISNHIHMSTSQLYRKLKALTGLTPILFIRKIRMDFALTLLQTEDIPLADIAFRVGLDDPGYFSKVFKKHFGFLPSDKKRLTEKNK